MNICLLTPKNLYAISERNPEHLVTTQLLTDNGIIKVKTINENGDYKWVKITDRNDLD